ncbi:division/cell wall cluster transcriptional repressor MraZ [Sphingomonas sp. CJ99]
MSGGLGYFGVAVQTVDDKGRVALPGQLRSTVEMVLGPDAMNKDMRRLTIATHEKQPCLVAYDPASFQRHLADVDARARAHAGPDGAINDQLLRNAIGVPEYVTFDANGRFVLPPYLRFRAKIDRYAFFWGGNDRIEIWKPETLMALDHVSEDLRGACQFHLERLKAA